MYTLFMVMQLKVYVSTNDSRKSLQWISRQMLCAPWFVVQLSLCLI